MSDHHHHRVICELDADTLFGTGIGRASIRNDGSGCYVRNDDAGESLCEHRLEKTRLESWISEERDHYQSLCPECETNHSTRFERICGRRGGTNGVDLEELFDAFNLKPDPLAGHTPIPEIDGPPPHMEEGFMMWSPGDGRDGWVPMDSDGRRLDTSEYYGKLLDQIPKRKVTEFKISYIIAYPATRSRGKLDDLQVIGMEHGVPGNARWKIGMMRLLGKFAVVVAWHMLGMGSSDQVLDYKLNKSGGEEENEAWDWVHDVPYVHELMTQHIPGVLQMSPKTFVFQSDDWGSGIHLRYAEAHDEWIKHNFFGNPIWIDGYFVIEIGTIGRLADKRRRDLQSFYLGAFGLPKDIIGIEKYMVQKRWKMNRYTETDYIYPYQNVDYQSGKNAAEMHPNYWNIAVLADRSSRLAPVQLQPYHHTKNPSGFRPEKITKDVDIIWGNKDQMMPPSQMFRSYYLFPGVKSPHRVHTHEIEGANHFAEIDKPMSVTRAILTSLISAHGPTIIPVFLGNGDFIMKGDEKELKEILTTLYGAPKTN